MKLLLTGGAGYVGRVMASEMAARGDELTMVDNFLYGNGIQLPDKRIELVHDDVRDTKSVRKLANDVDVIIHLAAIVGDPACDLDKERAFQTNYVATKNIASIASDLDIPLVFFSTCSVYGASQGGILTETGHVHPLSTYAGTKLQAERSVQDIATEHLILRLGTVFGLSPRMRFDLAVNRMIAQATVNHSVTVFGGRQFRPFIHVRDVVANTIKAIDSEVRGLFNLGGNNYRIRDVAERIQGFTNCQVELQVASTDERDYAVDSNAAIKKWGAGFDHDLEFAVKEITNGIQDGMFRPYTDPVFNNADWLRKASKEVLLAH